MDELAVWYEVLRSLLPQVYNMRMIGECGTIVIGSPYTDEIAFVTEESLAGIATSEAVRMIQRELRPQAMIPGERREAC